MPVAVTLYDELGYFMDGDKTTAVGAAAGSAVVIKASPGRLVSVIITTAATAALTFFDNATTNSGTVIGAIPAAGQANGQLYTFKSPALNGITVNSPASSPAVTVIYS